MIEQGPIFTPENHERVASAKMPYTLCQLLHLSTQDVRRSKLYDLDDIEHEEWSWKDKALCKQKIARYIQATTNIDTFLGQVIPGFHKHIYHRSYTIDCTLQGMPTIDVMRMLCIPVPLTEEQLASRSPDVLDEISPYLEEVTSVWEAAIRIYIGCADGIITFKKPEFLVTSEKARRKLARIESEAGEELYHDDMSVDEMVKVQRILAEEVMFDVMLEAFLSGVPASDITA